MFLAGLSVAATNFSCVDGPHCLPGWRPGVCAVPTTSGFRAPRQGSGKWRGIGSAAACAALCRSDPYCSNVSYLPGRLTCSWFAECAELEVRPTDHSCTTAVAAPTASSAPRGSARAAAPRVAIVVALYPPKFGHARNLLSSMVLCGQTRRYLVLLVFSNTDDKASFHASLANSSALTALWGDAVGTLTVDPGAYRAEAYKKLQGVRHAFDRLACEYAITTDADVLFQSRNDFGDYFGRWSERRAIPAGNTKGVAWWRRDGAMKNACARVGLNASALPQCVGDGCGIPQLWYGDAPVYERRGFEAFLARFQWSSLSDKLNIMQASFLHASYLCYKALVEQWELLPSYLELEAGSSADQECLEVKHDYAFLWSRNLADERRLLLFHSDRPRFQTVTAVCGAPLHFEGLRNWCPLEKRWRGAACRAGP